MYVQAYTEVRPLGIYWNSVWNDIRGHLSKAGKVHRAESDEYCTSTVSIGGYTSSEFIAVLKHKFSP